MTVSRSISIAPHLIWREVDKEIIVIDVNSSDTYYTISGSGVDVWKYCVTGPTLSALMAEHQSIYPDAGTPGERETISFIRELIDAGLLVEG